MSSVSHEKQTAIKRMVVDLIADLKDNIFNTSEEEEEDMIKVELYFSRAHADTVYNHVVKYIYPHKDKILAKDLMFFIKEKSIFGGLPAEKVRYYSTEITNTNRIHPDDRDAIWDHFIALVAAVSSKK